VDGVDGTIGDNVAGFGDNVAVFGDIVAGVDGALRSRKQRIRTLAQGL